MTPDDLVALDRDPPDGVRVNMIMSLDGAAEFGGRAGPLSDANDQICCWPCAAMPTWCWSAR